MVKVEDPKVTEVNSASTENSCCLYCIGWKDLGRAFEGTYLLRQITTNMYNTCDCNVVYEKAVKYYSQFKRRD